MEMETGELEFEFFLAEKLGMHVSDVRHMPMADYIGWGVYFGRKAQKQQLAASRG
jgi:hypothetical protein